MILLAIEVKEISTLKFRLTEPPFIIIVLSILALLVQFFFKEQNVWLSFYL